MTQADLPIASSVQEIQTPETQTISDIHRQSVRWLWPGWVARGFLTLLDGDPGMGKSTLALDLAAWVSMVGFRPPPVVSPGSAPVADSLATAELEAAGVLVMSAEDDAARVIRPRLEAAGADLGRVFVQENGPGHPERPVQLPEDVPALGEIIARHCIGLVIVDPLMAFLGRSVQSSSDLHVRRALHRLKQLAERTQCAILVIRHLNKSSHMPAMYRGGGSIGILGACRIALVVGKAPGPDDERRVLAMNKCNFAQRPPSLLYHLEQCGETSMIVWDGECDWSADEVLTRLSEDKAEQLSRVEECARYIKGHLSRGSMQASLLMSFCQSDGGFAERTIARARKRLGVRAKKGICGTWELSLPG